MGFWMPLVRRWGRKVDVYYPIISSPDDAEKMYLDHLHLNSPWTTGQAFPECFDVEAVKAFAKEPGRLWNQEVILKHLHTSQEQLKEASSKFRIPISVQEKLNDWAYQVRRIHDRESHMHSLLRRLEGTEGKIESQ